MQTTVKKSFDTHWAEILENFDFGRVHAVMVFLNWTWTDRYMESQIPKIGRMIQCAQGLCKNAYESEWGNSASGGFQARYDKETDVLELAFVVEDWGTCE
jgi:hypothetical protein